MDANKDEAINCLKIAKNSINRTGALKFLNKARRLDPSIEIDEFLSLQPEAKNPNPNETTKEKPPFNPLPTSSEQEQVRVSKRKKAEQEQSYEQEQVQVAKRKKAEQVAVVREIKRKKDYYDILGVEKNSSADDIRKAYRKLSLKVHPDKNWAPGAEDSFKKLFEAFECLTNEEARRKYDLQTSPTSRRSRKVSVSRRSSKVSVSRRRSSRVEVIREVVVHLIFTDDVFVLTMLHQPFTMAVLMTIARSRAKWFKLTGSFKLKYEYEGKVTFLPREDDLGADNELRTCIDRLLSVGEEPIVIRAEFI